MNTVLSAASAALTSSVPTSPSSPSPSLAAVRIKRVVSSFLVTTTAAHHPTSPTPGPTALPPPVLPSSARESLRVAVFHRRPTMPTFPGHWAPCSGSIEPGETPRRAAIRELREETNALDSGGSLDDDDDDSAGAGSCRPGGDDETSHVVRSSSATVSQHGLYVDVPFPTSAAAPAAATTNPNSSSSNRTSIIRVYPFFVPMPPEYVLEMRGTEHDGFRWVSVPDLEELEPSVPGLAMAFHHATRGAYYLPLAGRNRRGGGDEEHDNNNNDAGERLARTAREWASDRTSGANAMARNALRLLEGFDFRTQRRELEALASCLAMMRPAMVAITHALRRFDATLERSVASDPDHPAARVLEELELESHRAVETAAEAVRRALITSPAPSDGALDAVKHVVVFSRSSTLVSVLRQLSSEYRLRVTCSKSSPGDEGEIMAQDLVRALLEEGGDGHTVSVAEDATLLDRLWWAKDRVHAVLVGADCILPDAVYNKVGTNALAEAATAAGVPVICCGDSFKTWDDSFPPPLEEIFEAVPRERFWEVVQ